MKNQMTRLKKILGSPVAGIVCFLFAITNRIIFTSLYSFIGLDTKLQLIYAENLLAGKGMGTTKYFVSDLNTPVFDTQQYFPPGFSFIIIPFLKLSGGDEYRAVLAFDIIVAVLFVVAVRLLGKKAGLPAALNNIVTLITGCSQYFFFMAWSSTDAISVCLALFALAETVSIINKREAISLWRAVSCGLLFCSPFLFRYMYLPITILLPCVILLYGIFLKDRKLRINGVKIFASIASFLFLFFIISLTTVGNALYVLSDEVNYERGLFLHQFDLCYPFLPASFINIDFGAQLIQRAFKVEYSQTIFFLKIINAILFVLFLILLSRFIINQKRNLQHSNHALIIIIGSLMSVTIIFLLTWLSITYKEYKEQTWGFYRWVYFSEGRYFAFLYIFIPLLFFICLHHYSSCFKKPFIRFFVFIALCCLVTETTHGVYYNIKILLHHKDLAYIRDADKHFRIFPTLITEIQKQNPDRELIVASPDKFSLYTASQMGYKAIFDYTNILEAKLKVSSKSLLIMPIQTRDLIYVSEYMEKNKPRLAYTVNGISIYTQEINPN